MKRLEDYRWPVLIFFFSLLTHLPGISNPILDHHAWAQTLRAGIARNYFEGDMNLFKPETDYVEYESHDRAPQLPLYSYLVALAYLLFGFNDVFGRWISVLFAALSAVSLYRLVRGLEGEWTARVSAVVFCLIPVRIYFMRAVMPESMAIFCLVEGFHRVLRWSETESFYPHGLAGTVLLTLVPLLKLAYLPLLLVPLVYLHKEKRSFLLRAEFVLSAGFALAALLGWYFYANSGRERSAGFVQQLLGEMGIVKEWASFGFWSAHFFSRFPELLTTYGGLVFFALGFRKFRAEGRRFWLVWFFATVLYIALCGGYGRVHQYVSLPFAPVNAVFIAAGALWAFRSWRANRALFALGILLAISIPVHASLRIRHWYRLDQSWVLKAREVVDQISRPSDLFFVNSQNQPFYLYHIHRRGYAVHLEGLGLEYFKEAVGKSRPKFLFTPLHETTGGWPELEPQIAGNFPLVYKDRDFSIYDLTEQPAPEPFSRFARHARSPQ